MKYEEDDMGSEKGEILAGPVVPWLVWGGRIDSDDDGKSTAETAVR